MAEGTPRGRRHGLATLAIAFAVLGGAALGVLVMDHGSHVDGPGIGLEWDILAGAEHHARTDFVGLVILACGFGTFVCFFASRSPGPFLFALIGIGIVSNVAALFVTARAAFPLWWVLGCERGHPYACYAAALNIGGERSRAYATRACAADVWPACDWLEHQREGARPFHPVTDIAQRPQVDMEACGKSVKYPSRAEAAGEEGDVKLRVSVDDRGLVRDAQVTSQAPYRLEEAARGALKYRCKFTPAIGRDGKPVDYIIDEYTFTFELR